MPEMVARKHQDDLEEVIRWDLQSADQRILNGVGEVAEALRVVSSFEDVDFRERHCGLLRFLSRSR
jgi:hypothetical protein